MIRSGEVDLDGEASLEDGVIVEFGAVVEGERFEVAVVTTEGSGCRAVNFTGIAGGELLEDSETGLSLDQGEDTVTHVAAHDGVAFPVTDGVSQFDFGWPLGNGALAWEDAPRIDTAITLACVLADDAGVSPEVAAGALVPSDATVDRFVADAQRAALSEDAGDLFGAPLAANEASAGVHIGRAEASPAAASAASGDGVTVGLVGPVLAVRRIDSAPPNLTGQPDALAYTFSFPEIGAVRRLPPTLGLARERICE
jgi:hypothetical protein